MASFLVPQKNKDELIHTAFSLVAKSETHKIFDRLLATASRDDITIPLLVLRIDQYQRWKKSRDIVLLSQLVEGLVLILVEHTPPEVYVDSINPNEFLVILPSRTGEQTAQFGNEVVKRFTDFSQKLMKSKRKKCTLSGGISVFPEDAKNRIELFHNARMALGEAVKKDVDEIMDTPQIEYTPREFKLTEAQIKMFSKVAKDLSVDESILMREAVDDLLLKYL